MKALTVQQPWAWAIVHGGKDVENRSQAWSYRGPLAIHAGARWSDRGGHDRNIARACVRRWPQPPAADAMESVVDGIARHGLEPALYPNTIARMGVLIGVVDLVGVHHHIGSGDRVDCCDSPWADAWYPGAGRLVHLELANPRPLERPIPCRGRLGLWTPPPDVLDELREAL